MVRPVINISFAVLVLIGMAVPAAAQGSDTSHWGFTVSFVPTWKAPSNVTYLYDDADELDLSGSEFTIGVARGKTYGGDWGFTYIRRSFKDGSYIDHGVGQACVGSTQCVDVGTRYTLDNVVLNGIEAHKFVSFATIKRRVQVGLLAGGGVAWQSGLMIGTYKRVVDWNQNGPVIEQGTEQVKYTDVFLSGYLSVVPIGQVELAANAILAPGLKVRFSGGYNFPGYQVARISAVYLVGAR